MLKTGLLFGVEGLFEKPRRILAKSNNGQKLTWTGLFCSFCSLTADQSDHPLFRSAGGLLRAKRVLDRILERQNTMGKHAPLMSSVSDTDRLIVVICNCAAIKRSNRSLRKQVADIYFPQSFSKRSNN